MSTYEIKSLDGLKPVAEGYKAIRWDSGTQQSFKYGEVGEKLAGRIFKVDGDIKECEWGLHFSKDPACVFRFYEPLGYNRYFKVRAYGDIIDRDDKCVASVLEFVEEYDLMQFIELIKKYDRSSNGNNHSYGNNYSNGNNHSYGNNCSYGTSQCFGLKNVHGAYLSAFCVDKVGIAFQLFNRQSTQERCDEVINKIKSYNWVPKWNNIYELKGDSEWWKVCFPQLVERTAPEAWSTMPKEMKDYIMSLPEYDEKIFNEITKEETK